MKNKLFGFLDDMPPVAYWGLFFICTWFFIITKIASMDLWWHMACGRFFVENGFYPPAGTFTFSPVTSSAANQATWLGDIVLYLIYKVGGEPGLQLFRGVLVVLPILCLAAVVEKKYNPWLLVLAIGMVVGSSQISLLRNSMFGLFFLPLIVWLWWFIKKKDTDRAYYLIFLYPPVIGLWSVMHGYALVGTGIVLLIFAGEVLDLFLKKAPRKFFRCGLFLMVAVGCYFIININLSLNITGTVKAFFQNSNSPAVQTVDTVQPSDRHHESQKEKFNIVNWIKVKSRFLMKGGDVGFIAEYNSPLDYLNLISSKALVGFCFVYLLYLILGGLFAPGHFRFSFLLPSIAAIIIGLGYLRTVPFPFLVAAPFMAAGIVDMRKDILQKNNPILKWVPNKTFVFFGIVPLALCVCFTGLAHYNIFKKQYSLFSKAKNRAPGFGRADHHITKMPEYILEHYPKEDMYNSYGAGSLLLWEWYGKKKVFLDSRSVNYEKNFYDDYRKNFSFNMFEKMGIKKALLNMMSDKSWYETYLKQNWNVVCFDSSMMLLERRVEEGYDKYYGQIPEFIGSPEVVAGMERESQFEYGRFLNYVIKYMLIFGRLQDSMAFYENMKPVIALLPDRVRLPLEGKYNLMTVVKEDFGLKNATAFADLFREILLVGKENREEAFLDYERSKATIFLAIGNSHIALGDMKKGVEYFSAAADLAKDNVVIQRKAAEHFFKMKALGPALKHYKRVVELDPGNVHEYNRLGFLYYARNDFSNAETAFKNAIESDPKVIESYINLAAIYMQQSKKGKAVEINKQGLEIDPGNATLEMMKKDLGY